MTKLFILVISLWGFNGSSWVYVGNQIVLNKKMQEQECLDLADSWSRYELNQYYRLSIECVEHHGNTEGD